MGSGASDFDNFNIEFFYKPESIAIVGASSDPRKPGGRPLAALLKRGYAGKIYPVNPRYPEIAGVRCYPTILEVPGNVDMAIIGSAGRARPSSSG
jgi:acetyltransferase